MVRLHIIKRIRIAATHYQKFCLHITPTLGMVSIGLNLTFLEQGNVAYQIKGNHECTNMVANILPADPQYPHTLGMRAIGQNSSFSECVMLHIIIYWNHKCSNKVAFFLPPGPPDLNCQKVKFNFFRTMSCCILN